MKTPESAAHHIPALHLPAVHYQVKHRHIAEILLQIAAIVGCVGIDTRNAEKRGRLRTPPENAGKIAKHTILPPVITDGSNQRRRDILIIPPTE